MKFKRILILWLAIVGFSFSPAAKGQPTIATGDILPIHELSRDGLSDYFLKRFYYHRSDNYIPTDSLLFSLFVDENGKLRKVRVLQKFRYYDTRQIIHLLQASGDWSPVEINGKKESSEFLFRVVAGQIYHQYSAVSSFGIRIGFSSQLALESNDEALETYVFDRPRIVYDDELLASYQTEFGRNLAQLTMPYFVKNCLPENEPMVLTVLVDKSGKSGEYAWLKVKKEEGGRFYCSVANPPQYVGGYRPGDTLSIALEKVLDWLLTAKTGSIGGFTDINQRNITIQNAKKELSAHLSIDNIVLASNRADRAIMKLPDEVDEQAVYAGGLEEFNEYLTDNMAKRSEPQTVYYGNFYDDISESLEISDKIYLSFFVLENGIVVNPRVICGTHEIHQQDLIKAMSFMNKWKPATKNGLKSNSLITFRLKNIN